MLIIRFSWWQRTVNTFNPIGHNKIDTLAPSLDCKVKLNSSLSGFDWSGRIGFGGLNGKGSRPTQ